MPKTNNKKMNNNSKKITIKSTVKKGGLKKSSTKKLKLVLISSIVFILTVFFGYRLISGNWIGADAEVPYNYNAYYEKCNPAIRDAANFKISEGAVDSNQATERGQCVKAVQKALNDCCGGGLVEDGRFGPLTKQAIINFQNFFKDPSPDGVVDKDLWNGLDYVHSVQLANKNNKPWKNPSEIWQEALARRTTKPVVTPTPTTPAPTTPTPPTPTTTTTPTPTPTPTITPDTQKPTKPSDFTAIVEGPSDNNKNIKLKWNASTDNVGISRYVVYRLSQGYELEVKSTIGTTTTIDKNDNISAGVNYSFYVVAFDAAGNRSDKSAPRTIKLPAPPPADITVPVVESPSTPKCSPGERLDGGICEPRPITICTSSTAEPKQHYKAVPSRNGCVSRYNENLLVKCFSGYKLEGAFVNNCVKVQISNIGGDPGNSWRTYQSDKYKGAVTICPLLTYRNAETKACHNGQMTGMITGDKFTAVVHCFQGNRPFYKTTGKTEYKCMK